jgi:hypothetical protein
VLGGRQASAFFYGEVAHAAGRFSVNGDAQNSFLVMRRSVTVGAAATDLTLDGAVVGATNTLIMANDTMYQFVIKVAARESGGGANDFAWWNIVGGIKRQVGVATTTIVGANVVDTGTLGANATGWTCVAQANTTTGALQVQVSAPAGVGPVRFVASVYLTRVG